MSRILYSPPLPSIATATIDQPNSSSSSSSSSSSIIIVSLTIVSAIIISISLYLLLRFLSQRCSSSFSLNDAIIPSTITTTTFSNNTNRTPHKDDDNLLDHLPLFTFRSLTSTNSLTAADCAVCLSKFEPNDQLRLLPFCCHAFHAPCIDTWLKTNYTCPLCRSSLYHNNNNDNADLSDTVNDSNSFRVSVGSISRRRNEPDAGNADHDPVIRSFSAGSFEYVVDVDGFEVSVGSTQLGRLPECAEVGDKECGGGVVEPPGERVAAEVGGGGRSWLRDYVDRITLVSSRSLRSSGRFFPGSGRRSDGVAVVGELESSRIDEEISEVFRWLSGV